MNVRLSPLNHDRDAAGMKYVYPVVSRRARGVSVGINLNPNNLCNWRCVYCQVPGLAYGKAPAIDLPLLHEELSSMLSALVEGDYMQQHVPESSRRLNDVAFSGNGEPTSSEHLENAIELAAMEMDRLKLLGKIDVILITNGSLVHKKNVQSALKCLASHGGQVWFKLDSATDAGMQAINSASSGAELQMRNLAIAAKLCPTWIQTCVLATDEQPPSEAEQTAYLAALEQLAADKVNIKGVLLYGLARQSHQPEADSLSALRIEWLNDYAQRIRDLGFEVRVNA